MSDSSQYQCKTCGGWLDNYDELPCTCPRDVKPANVPHDPLSVPCRICNAKPGERCGTITSPMRYIDVPHYTRGLRPTAYSEQVHELKTWPEPFAAVLAGTKTHEVRKNDRGYAVGDLLVLKEWDPSETCASCPHKPHPHDTCKRRSGGTAYACLCLCSTTRARGYTGHSTSVRVTHITYGGTFGLPADVCVMSVRRLP